MRGVIMAGGFGTRLRPLSTKIPKPLVPVANFPMIEHIIRLLKKHDITELSVLLYFQAEKIIEYLGDGSRFGVTIDYKKPEEDLGTAGAVRFATKDFDEPVLIISGDLITDFNLKKSIDFHHKAEAEATIVLYHHPNPLAYGIVMTDDNGRIKRFLEKPSWGEVFSDGINTGIYILEPEGLDMIPPDKPYDFSNDLYPDMLARQKRLFGSYTTGYWKDVGNLSDYIEVHKNFNERIFMLELPGYEFRNGAYFGENVSIGEEVEITGTCVIGSDTVIENGSKIRSSIIGANCHIGEKTKVYSSVLWHDVAVESRSFLNTATITNGNKIGKNVFISEKAVIGDHCTIEDNAKLKPNVKIWPDKNIESGAVVNSSLVWGDSWQRELFTDSRITGLVNVEITPEFAARLGTAFGAFMGEGNTVTISRDSSNASRMVTRSLMTGITSSGSHIEDLQVSTIPVNRYMVRHSPSRAGIHVRKTATDPRRVDIIFVEQSGKDFPTGRLKTIERLFFGEDYRRASYDNIGSIQYPIRAQGSYTKDFLSHLDMDIFAKRRFKIIVDYAYGASSLVFPKILGQLNVETISLNAYLDPNKLTFTEEEMNASLSNLQSIVASLKADGGFLINSSGEQVYALDNNGSRLSHKEFSMILAEMLFQEQPGINAGIPINGTDMMEEIAAKYKGEVVRCKTSHGSMMEMAEQIGIKFVSGTRGGIIFPEFFFASDALFTIAKTLELLAKFDSSLSERKSGMKFTHCVSKDLPCSWQDKGALMRRIIESTESQDRIMIDGIKVFSEAGSVFLLPHREKASFVIKTEAPRKKEAENLSVEWYDKLSSWLK